MLARRSTLTRMKLLRRAARTELQAMRHVTLYTRAGCHLCDDAKKPVSRAVAAIPGADLRVVDIAGDTDLEARYGLRISVVTVSDSVAERVIAEGKVSEIWLRRALATGPEA